MTWRSFGRTIGILLCISLLSSAITGASVGVLYAILASLADGSLFGRGAIDISNVFIRIIWLILLFIFFGGISGVLTAAIPTFIMGSTLQVLQMRAVYFRSKQIWVLIGCLFGTASFGFVEFLSKGTPVLISAYLVTGLAGGLNAFLFRLFASRWITFTPLQTPGADERLVSTRSILSIAILLAVFLITARFANPVALGTIFQSLR